MKRESIGPARFRKLSSHFRTGIRHGYPICCVLHFCWDNMLGRAAGMTRWKQVQHDRRRGSHVPCGLFHPGGSSFSLCRRIHRTLRFEWQFLQPTRQGRRRRGFQAHGGPHYRAATIEDRQRADHEGVIEKLWWKSL